jgi:hypothetical protein
MAWMLISLSVMYHNLYLILLLRDTISHRYKGFSVELSKDKEISSLEHERILYSFIPFHIHPRDQYQNILITTNDNCLIFGV